MDHEADLNPSRINTQAPFRHPTESGYTTRSWPAALSSPQTVLNSASPFVTQRIYRNGGQTLALTASSPAPLDGAILRCLLGSLCPARTPEAAADETAGTIESIRRNHAALVATAGPAQAEEDKAVEGEAERPMTVTFAPGAFDALLAERDREDALTIALLDWLSPLERRAVIEEPDD